MIDGWVSDEDEGNEEEQDGEEDTKETATPVLPGNGGDEQRKAPSRRGQFRQTMGRV